MVRGGTPAVGHAAPLGFEHGSGRYCAIAPARQTAGTHRGYRLRRGRYHADVVDGSIAPTHLTGCVTS
jgi:hypothetical protein